MQSWLTAHRDQLPRTYDALRAYPATYQIGIFSSLPAAEQAALWTSHIDTYLRNHPDLSQEQRDVLTRARTLGTPALYAGHAPEAELAQLEQQARRAFSRAELNRIFTDLGGHAPEGITHLAGGAGKACTCSTADDRCNIGQKCKKDGCTASKKGCGWLWREACDGRCYLPIFIGDAGASDEDGGWIEGDNTNTYGSDMSTDMAGDLGAAPDLATPQDMSMPPDLAPADDFSMPPDLASPPDLAPADDFSTPPDLASPPDMAPADDFSTPPDLASPPDLAAGGLDL